MWLLIVALSGALPSSQEEVGFRQLQERAYGVALATFEDLLESQSATAALHYGRGLALTGLLRYRDAAQAFESALALDPSHTASLVELVVLYGQLGEDEAARAAFEKLDGVPLSEQVRLARALRKAGLMEQARACFTSGASLTKAAHGELGLIAAELGDCDQAVAHFAASHGGASLEVENGRCLETLGRPDEAAASYRRSLAAEPSLRRARFRLGNLLLRSGKREEGLALLEGYESFRQWERRTKLLLLLVTSGTLPPHDDRVRTLQLIDLYLQGGALDEASALIDSGQAKYASDASFRVARTRWLLASSDQEGARRMLDALVAEAEPPVDALWLSARLHLNGGRAAEATKDYERFVARVDHPPAVLLKELATAHAMTGNADASIIFFERAIATDPSLAESRADLGLLLGSLGKPAEAEEQYRRALQVNPRLVSAQQGLGSLLLEKGELEAAEALFRKSVEARPTEPRLRRNLALALTRLGREDEALAQLEAARELQK